MILVTPDFSLSEYGFSKTLIMAKLEIRASRAINNEGTVAWISGAIQVLGGTSAEFTNLTSGVFDVQNDQSLRGFANFNNAGTLKKTAGSGTSLWTEVCYVDQGGSIDFTTAGDIDFKVCGSAVPPTPPVAADDSAVNPAPVSDTNTTTINAVHSNDSDSDGTVQVSTIDLDPTTVGQQTIKSVVGEGVWTVDTATGNVTFDPVATLTTDPSTINYTIRDNNLNVSNEATLTVAYTAGATTWIWDGSTDGDGDGTRWSDPFNWENDIVPNNTSNVFIGRDKIDLEGVAITVASLEFGGDTLGNGGADELTTTNGFAWTKGILNSKLNIMGNSTISGTADKHISGASEINNSGTITWTGTGNILGFAPTSPRVNNNGTFNIKNDATFFVTGLTFDNDGTVKKMESSGDSNWRDITFNNSSSDTVNVETGTLRLGSGNHTGKFTVASGALLRFNLSNNAGQPLNVTLTETSLIEGDGTVEFSGGSNGSSTSLIDISNSSFPKTTKLNGAGNVIIKETARFTDLELAGVLLVSTNAGVSINVTGKFDWLSSTFDGGNITVDDTVNNIANNTAELNLDSGVKTLKGNGKLILNGTTNFNGGALVLEDSVEVDNNGTILWGNASSNFVTNGTLSINPKVNNNGVIDIQVDLTSNVNRGLTFNNAGTLKKTGVGDLTKDSRLLNNQSTFFINTGIVQLEENSGTLTVGGGSNDGTITVASGAKFKFGHSNTGTSTTFTTTANSIIEGSGTIEFGFGGGTTVDIHADSDYSPATTVLAGGFSNTVNINTDYPSAELIRISSNNGTLKLNGVVTTDLNNLTLERGTLSGTANITVSGTFTWANNRIEGSGVLTLEDTSNTQLNGAVSIGGSRIIENNGTVTMSSNGTISNGGIGTPVPRFENTTTSKFYIQNDGDFNVSSGGNTLIFNNAGLVEKNGTTGESDWDGIIFNNTGTVNVKTGILSLGGGDSSGTFTVDDPATLEFSPSNNSSNTTKLLATSEITGDGILQIAGGNSSVVNIETSIIPNVFKLTGGTANYNGAITKTFTELEPKFCAKSSMIYPILS